MRKAGLQNVTVQPVMVPRWVRGSESGTMITTGPGAVNRSLHMLGLGMSVGTPAGGITAPVVFVPSFDALDAMTPEQVKGKIVVYNPGGMAMASIRSTGPTGHRALRQRAQWRCWCGPRLDWRCRFRIRARWCMTRSSRRFLRRRSRWKMR